MPKDDVIGSTADKQMDAFWAEYRAKMATTLKVRKSVDEDDEDIPSVAQAPTIPVFLQIIITAVIVFFLMVAVGTLFGIFFQLFEPKETKNGPKASSSNIRIHRSGLVGLGRTVSDSHGNKEVA